MTFSYVDWKENDNLVPIEVPNKEKYYHDLDNIEHSWTGRIDAQLSNTFIHEAVQLIINAIVLFEKGYIDCAFYSLRQSLEVSTTMVYLMELTSEKQEEELQNWKMKSKFPMYGQMLVFLNENGAAFADIKGKMNAYFSRLQKVKVLLNKHVHKQGFNTFYVSRNHILNKHREQIQLDILEDFELSIKSCIGSIAIFRLAIDPFPILLMDQKIYARTGDLMTEAYSEEFVEEYIGETEINAYKQTEIYIGYYEAIQSEEEKLPCVVDVVKHQYIDKNKYDDILSQSHLLSRMDFLAVLISMLSEKIANIYCYDGWLSYHTSTSSVRKFHSFDSRALKDIKNSSIHLNISYDEAFLSLVSVNNEDFFIEHNDVFTEHEHDDILNLIDHINNMGSN